MTPHDGAGHANRELFIPTHVRNLLLALATAVLAGCGGVGDDGGASGGSTTEGGQSGATSTVVEEGGAVTTAALDPSGEWTSLLADAATCPNQRSSDADPAVLERAAVCLVNQARRTRGLQPLERVDVLDESAADKADDLVRCNEFSHSACDEDVRSSFEAVGYGDGCRSWRVGENLGFGELQAGTPRSIVLGWLRSPGHRRNLLGTKWEQQGMAVVARDELELAVDDEARTFEDALVWVNHFGARSGC